MIIVTSSFLKSFVFKMFYVHTTTPAFLNSSGLKSVFEKLCSFRDGLAWTLGLPVEIMLRFQILLA